MSDSPSKDSLWQSLAALCADLPDESRKQVGQVVAAIETVAYTERRTEEQEAEARCRADAESQTSYLEHVRAKLAEARSDLMPHVCMGLEEGDLPEFTAALDRYAALARVVCRTEDAQYLDSLPPGGEALRGPYWYREGVHEAANLLRDRCDAEKIR